MDEGRERDTASVTSPNGSNPCLRPSSLVFLLRDLWEYSKGQSQSLAK